VELLADQPFKINTSRLILREFCAQDAGPLFALNSDEEVLRYTGDEPFRDIQAATDFITNYAHYRDYGYGRWAVIGKESSEFMGFCGLRRHESSGEVDLGFRLFQQFWSRGFATEAAGAALFVGFERFGLDEIVGRAMRENLPSITVLQKLGMQFREVSEENQLFWLVYAISAESFRKQADL